jgi:beta-phosphoglucomutase
MIKAVIFDLDGVILKSEELKAQAYVIAIKRLTHSNIPESAVVEAYREVVGVARDEASRHIMQKLSIEDKLLPLMAEYGVSHPEEVLTVARVAEYQRMIADPRVIRDSEWQQNTALLRISREVGCKTALATMSRYEEVVQILNALSLAVSFDVIVTSEDVRKGKPDPEIYFKAANKLNVQTSECLVLEDSVNGVKSAIAAGTNVVAIATPFTSKALHAARIVKEAWMVHKPEDAPSVVQRRIQEINRIEKSKKKGKTGKQSFS